MTGIRPGRSQRQRSVEVTGELPAPPLVGRDLQRVGAEGGEKSQSLAELVRKGLPMEISQQTGAFVS